MLILLLSLASYWSGTPITSLTNPDYRAYDSPYNYNFLQLGAGVQNNGLDIDLGGSYMLDEHWMITGQYQNKFLHGGDLPTGQDSLDSKFNQSTFSLGAMYRMPINRSLDAVFGSELSYDWYKGDDLGSTADQVIGLESDDGSVGVTALTGLRYSITDKLETGVNIGAKYVYDRTYLQTSTEMNYYFTENIALGGQVSYSDNDGHVGFYIRISN